MGRRRKNDDDWIEPVVKVGALIILFAVITPQGRQLITTIGFIAVCLGGVALAGLIGFVIYRIATRSKRPSALDSLYQYAESKGKRDLLIDRLEKRLSQKTSNEHLFSIRWQVV